jgi:hypothetical protein
MQSRLQIGEYVVFTNSQKLHQVTGRTKTKNNRPASAIRCTNGYMVHQTQRALGHKTTRLISNRGAFGIGFSTAGRYGLRV